MTSKTENKVDRVVDHKKLYLAVGGKLQHVPKGTKVTITESQAAKLGSKLVDPSLVESVDLTDTEESTEKDK